MKLGGGQPAPQELIDLLTPGNRVQVHSVDYPLYNSLYHILAIVDENMIVCKRTINDSGWIYTVDTVDFFYAFYRDGEISKG